MFFEEENLKYMDRYLNKDSVVFDLGANVGNHTVYWGKITDSVGVKRIHAFEPVDQTFAILEKNVEINKLGDRVVMNKVGVGRGESRAVLRYAFDYGRVGNSELKISTDEKDEDTFKVISLDEYIKSPNFKDDYIDLIKIDVEGFEEEVLLGAKETLEKYNPIIFIEAWPENFEKIDKLLTSLNYRMEKKLEADNYLYIKQK
jgi:FkbM family methyltransferase